MSLFASFLLGGFECSTHRLRNGRRLDLIGSTRHDRFAVSDYAQLRRYGFRTVREGLRWHLIEREDGEYNFASALPLLEAARQTDMEVVWDFLHFGWPDGIDIFSHAFIWRFASFARAAASTILPYTERAWICPINEISFLSWAAGEAGAFYPFALRRGNELKRQLVAASVAATLAIRQVAPKFRFCHIDPLIHVAPDTTSSVEEARARAYHDSQFDACAMMMGKMSRELGGGPDLIDAVGLNYYLYNQWTPKGGALAPGDPRRIPLHSLLAESYRRFGKPIFIAETGIEDDERPLWLRDICAEVVAAQRAGVPVEAICLYPIANHPGWDDDRHVYNGLLDYPDANGARAPFASLLEEIRRQQALWETRALRA